MNTANETETTTGQALKRVGHCLYRSDKTRGYYAILRRGGKQFKRSLKTNDAALAKRREVIHGIDKAGIVATPANSSFNELVVEAARLSIQTDGDWCNIVYGNNPHVEMKRR